MNPIRAIKLWRDFSRLESYLKGGPVNGFDPKVSLYKGFILVLKSVLGAVVFAVTATLSNSTAVASAFSSAGVPEAFAATLSLVFLGLAEAIRNAYKFNVGPESLDRKE